MIYWLLFLIYELGLLLIFSRSDIKTQKICLILITIGLIYFAGFRDGLGVDYLGYVSATNVNFSQKLYMLSLFDEPIYSFFKDWIYDSEYSPVVFFVLMSIITNVFVVSAYSRYKDFPFLMFVYIIYPALYATSFNLVRQFAAGTIFLLGIEIYRSNKNIWIYLFLLLFAFMIHKSAIVLLFILLIRDKEINPLLWGGSVLASWIIPFDAILGSMSTILAIIDYDHYLLYTETPISKTSLVNLYMHLIFFLFLFNIHKIKLLPNANNCIFALKMVAIFLVCYNASANNIPIAYRIAVYFSLFIPILFIYLKFILNPIIAKIATYLSFIILFTLGVLANEDLIPKQMMPLDSIYDEVFETHYREPLLID